MSRLSVEHLNLPVISIVGSLAEGNREAGEIVLTLLKITHPLGCVGWLLDLDDEEIYGKDIVRLWRACGRDMDKLMKALHDRELDGSKLSVVLGRARKADRSPPKLQKPTRQRCKFCGRKIRGPNHSVHCKGGA